MTMAASPRLTAILAIASVAVLVACSTSTPGSAGPAATTSATTASSSPVVASTTTQSPTTPAPTTGRSIATGPPSDTSTSGRPATVPASSSPESVPSGPDILPTDLAGVVYGFIKGVDVARSQLTLDKIDWFTGAAAVQACDEDGVPQDGRVNEWCSMYYFRNVNPALRVVTVSPQVAVTTLDGNSNVEVAGDLAALADRVTTLPGSSRPYRLTVTDGVVIDVTELYQP